MHIKRRNIMTTRIPKPKCFKKVFFSLTLILMINFMVLGVPPKAYDMPINTFSNQLVQFELAADDAENDALTFSIESQPKHGTVVLNDNLVTYTPQQGFTGSDSFTFKADDGSESSNLATVNITVKKLRDIIVTDKDFNIVADGEVSDSTLLHIVVKNNSGTEISAYKYFCLMQDTQPSASEWAAATEDQFYEDLYFFREPTTQWVKVEVAFSNGDAITKTVALKGGILDGPPDDPIDPWKYADDMGFGFDADWNEDFSTKYIVLLKKCGFKNIRLRRGELKKTEPVAIKKLLRHGIHIVLAWFGNGNSSDEFWTYWSEKTKNLSHLLMFDIFVEVLQQNPLLLNVGTKRQMTVIRKYAKTRNVAIHPAGYRVDPGLHKYTEIPEESGYFIFGQWHTYWCSGVIWKNLKSREDMSTYNNDSEKWTRRSGAPGWDAALMIGVTRLAQAPYIGEHLGFVKKIQREHKIRHIPLSVNAFPRNVRYVTNRNWEWIPRYKIIYQALQSDKVIFNPNDWDGDTISNNDEINKYHTDPRNADTDGDKILDADEIKFGFDPLNSDDGTVNFAPPYYPAPADDDGDGVPNAFEIIAGGDPKDPNDADLDADNDLLTNLQEYELDSDPRFGISPRNPIRVGLCDLDRDGYGTIVEYQLGRDPQVKEDPTNKPPRAVSDSYTTSKDTPIVLDLLANDSDDDNDPIKIYEFYPTVLLHDMPVVVGNYTKRDGTLKVNADSTVTYTPKSGFVGTDGFFYAITDDKGFSGASVTITVK